LTLVLKLNVEASNYLGEKVLVSVTVYSDFWDIFIYSWFM
jgi:hypothetical protein